jgi:hypothetical protein
MSTKAKNFLTKADLISYTEYLKKKECDLEVAIQDKAENEIHLVTRNHNNIRKLMIEMNKLE